MESLLTWTKSAVKHAIVAHFALTKHAREPAGYLASWLKKDIVGAKRRVGLWTSWVSIPVPPTC
jgi:hypothetical protein